MHTQRVEPSHSGLNLRELSCHCLELALRVCRELRKVYRALTSCFFGFRKARFLCLLGALSLADLVTKRH
jgi:hypothetical protein